MYKKLSKLQTELFFKNDLFEEESEIGLLQRKLEESGNASLIDS